MGYINIIYFTCTQSGVSNLEFCLCFEVHFIEFQKRHTFLAENEKYTSCQHCNNLS
jgi:hypothetical protein